MQRSFILAAALAALCVRPGLAGILDEVAACWSIDALSAEAQAVVVTLEVPMEPDGRPAIDAIRLTEFSGGSQDAADEAFEAARRAVIRCGVDGFTLPEGDYAEWQTIQMTFDPSQMRVR